MERKMPQFLAKATLFTLLIVIPAVIAEFAKDFIQDALQQNNTEVITWGLLAVSFVIGGVAILIFSRFIIDVIKEKKS